MSKKNKKRQRNHHHPGPNQTHAEQHMPGDIHVRGEIEVRRDPSLVNEHNTERNEDTSQAGKKYELERRTFIALCVYTGLTLILALLSGIAIYQSRIHFTQDQRPYLWITDNTGPCDQEPMNFPGDAAGKLGCVFRIKNYGKGPAIKYHSLGRILFGKDAEQRINFDLSKIDQTNGPVLPPGKEDYNSAWSETPVDPALVGRIKTKGLVEYMVISGYISYWDTSGNLYGSEFCLERNPELGFAYCKTHNFIK